MAEQKREILEERTFAFPAKGGGNKVPQRPTPKEQHSTDMAALSRAKAEGGRPSFPPRPNPHPEAAKPRIIVEDEPLPAPAVAAASQARSTQQAQAQTAPIEKNSSYVDITLPSNFHFYDFKSLAVRHFRAPEQAKCIRAAKEGRFKHLVDAISATLQPGISAYDLTHEDFYAIMYWHRMNSFSRLPYTHDSFCENPEHLAEVLAGKLPDESLKISTIITKAMLKENQFNAEGIVIPPALAEKYQLGVLRAKDMVELEEMEELPEFDDIEFLGDLASYLHPLELKRANQSDPVKFQSIKDRIQIVAGMDPDEVEDMQTYIRSVSNYGISETVNVKCRGCGAERESKVSIDALAFLPSSR